MKRMSTQKARPEPGPTLLAGEVRSQGPVTCLGQTFASDEVRREHYRKRLAEKLKDPAFRNTPGFPKGTDEAILRMSDPPYYTACPNPFLEEFLRVHGRLYDPKEEYRREPFAVDVSVGKTDPIYKAHGYHTKVPHLAIVPSILHYTRPGDVVFDGFCGSGMTGVAAQWCGTAPADYRTRIEAEWRRDGHEPPEWGARKVVLGDLGPAATFIAANYNLPFDVDEFATAAQQILDDVADELGWMYETLHTDGKTKGRINYTVWSEVFTCPECSGEIVFLAEALDHKTKRVHKNFPCPSCFTLLTKPRLERVAESIVDHATNTTVQITKRQPVFINYSIGNTTKFEKPLDDHDRDILRRVAAYPPSPILPVDRMMHTEAEGGRWGDEWRSGVASFVRVHHLFLPRSAHAMALLWERALEVSSERVRRQVLFFVEQAIWGLTTMARYAPTHFSQVNQYMSGRIRVLSQHAECSPWYVLAGKLHRLTAALSRFPARMETVTVGTGACGNSPLKENSVDYIFTDPPFGGNFAYSELNFIVESWHRVFTNQEPEAIVSDHQKKGTEQYQRLMRRCFSECYRILKPGRWMTMVFSNSSNVIWHAIQEALGTAGFVVADVRTLDKQQGTFNQVHGVSVDQDLIISAYKPSESLAGRFGVEVAGTDHVWSFVDEHLDNTPVFVGKAGGADVIKERSMQMLHDRMVAFFVQRRVAVPVSSAEFFVGLNERYVERDGMYFLPDQIPEYDRKRTTVNELTQATLFVQDESSATQWVRQELQGKPQTFQELQPQFMQQLQAWAKHETKIELKEILELNFLCYEGDGPVPSQIHGYLSANFKEFRRLGEDAAIVRAKAAKRWYVPNPNKEGDLEKIRLRMLLRAFDEYRVSTKRKVRQFRSEAVRAGFKHCYDTQDYRTIVDVAARLPEEVIQEDEKLLMYYDVAAMRLSSG